MKYKIIALIGKSGSGKDYLMQECLKRNKELHEIISCTTRPIREGEQAGVNYYYLTNEEFTNKLLNNEMLEATIFNEWCYGTSIDSLSKDKINIGVFNPDGIRILADRVDIELKVLMIEASGKNRLLRQLNREENPDIEEIMRRYKVDECDFDDLDFDYQTIDNNIDGLPALLEQIN